MFYLLFSICISSFLFVIFKLFDVLKINTFQAIVVNYLTAAILGFYLSNNSVSFQQIPSQPWFLGAFLLGIMFILVFNVMALTSQKNGLSVASVSSKMSVVIAIIFGVWYYEESIGLVKLIGILLALVAVYLTSIKEKNEIVKKNKDFLFPVLLFFGSGAIDTSLKYVETSFVAEGGVPLFSATIFGCAFVLGVIVLLYQKVKGILSFEFKSILGGILLGVPNYFSIVYLLKALSTEGMESSTAFTLNNVGIVILSTLFGLFIFKEKLISKNWFGIIIAIVSIILIMSVNG
ncbi:MAG: EamA family transporter [Flavobacteriaceae bacterium]|jgi:drug/metabolite transporter (DMT)-like permease|nr:DMT family transporter [Flavobacteriaceae bacterium]MDG1161691.1 EamA family transporter [Flavobacteriaceae bacterium]MDG1422900.1 EamA family transporter [Flavobacteriaceae bacterium]MDG1980295.1 EamA family transporter [Flavobacteriaceae bacterium]MDG2444080.1 EamA family transporter [Flavobacteriaceae bacterium]|tara:strand:+ start:8974 stop:9846 length:873 start_codon:yes stop_codon:yes gene_type:complete